MHTGDDDTRALRAGALCGDDDDIILCVNSNDIVLGFGELWLGDVESVSLADRVKRRTLMHADKVAFFIGHLPLLNDDETLEKISHAHVSDKTQALAVGLLRDGKRMRTRVCAHLFFRHRPNGERGARQIALVELIQKIGLVF